MLIQLILKFVKGVWGAPGCELDPGYLDPKDPNYDSEEEQGNIVMVSYENEMEGLQTTEVNLKPELKASEFDFEVKLVILEYFQNGDSIEVILFKLINKFYLNTRLRFKLLRLF